MDHVIECGKIVNAHGCRGTLKIEVWADSAEVLTSLPKIYLAEGPFAGWHKVTKAVVFRQFVLMDAEGISDMDAALSQKEKVVYADRADIPLPEGKFFIADLIGLTVTDDDTKEVIGTLQDVVNRGGGDLYQIRLSSGETCLVPAVPEFIRSVSLTEGIRLHTIPGLLGEGV